MIRQFSATTMLHLGRGGGKQQQQHGSDGSNGFIVHIRLMGHTLLTPVLDEYFISHLGNNFRNARDFNINYIT